MPEPAAETVLSRFLRGEAQALSRLLSLIENDDPQAAAVLEAVYPRAHHARRIGLTGAPGAGKSTLVNELAPRLMAAGESLGVLAVDPSSPLTGGAVLGDRIRFAYPEPAPGQLGAFFRSTATRGHTGGLAHTTEAMAVLLDAFGYGRLLIESVGVGQVGWDIAEACDTTVVLVVPEGGDAIQALKAGLLEVADVIAVNKADRPGADALLKQLRDAVHFRRHHRREGWSPPVLPLQAHTGEGVDALVETVDTHHAWLLEQEGAEGLRKRRLRQVIHGLLREQVRTELDAALCADRLPDGRALGPLVEQVHAGERNPFALVREVMATVFRRDKG